MSDISVYDKAKWHYEHHSYPKDLPKTSGFLYGGFFLAWAFTNGLIDYEELEEFSDDFQSILNRDRTPSSIYMIVDGVLTSDMFNEEGNAFAWYCFESEEFDYYLLFEEALAQELPSPYHVPDNWKAYDKLAKRLDVELNKWRQIRTRFV
jgi:hypothetical protein